MNTNDDMKNYIRNRLLKLMGGDSQIPPRGVFLVHDNDSKRVWIWFVNCDEYMLTNTQTDKLNTEITNYENMGFTYVLPEYKIIE